MAFFSSVPLFGSYSDLLRKFAARLAVETPRRGLEWLNTLDASEARFFAISAFAEKLQRVHPDLVSELGPSLDAHESNKRAFYGSASLVLAKADLEAAVTMITSAFDDEASRNLLIGCLADTLGSRPGELVGMAQRHPNAVDPMVLGRSLYKLWKSDRQEAERLVSKLPPGDGAAASYDSFTESYLEDDYVAASSWVAQLPSGASRDFAVAALSRGIANQFPVDALKWAVTIERESAREAMVEVLLPNAWKENPAAAEAALKSGLFSPSAAENWMSKARRGDFGHQ